MTARRSSTADAHVYASPKPETVAAIMATKGLEAASERWFWCEPRSLAALARIGQARTGIASQDGGSGRQRSPAGRAWPSRRRSSSAT